MGNCANLRFSAIIKTTQIQFALLFACLAHFKTDGNGRNTRSKKMAEGVYTKPNFSPTKLTPQPKDLYFVPHNTIILIYIICYTHYTVFK